MYCPQCASENVEGTRFCRACGTDLETVALALSGQLVPSSALSPDQREAEAAKEWKAWLEKRSTAVRAVTRGAILLSTSLLIALAMAVFVPERVPWIIAWAFFFGWMAGWGAVELASGVSRMLETGVLLRGLPADAARQRLAAAQEALPNAGAPRRYTPLVPPSVTEPTTRRLGDDRSDG